MKEEFNLKEQLYCCKSDKRKIYLHFIIRFLIVATIVTAGVMSNPPKGMPVNFFAGIFLSLIVAAVFVWMIQSLFHIKDYIIFYQNEINFCGKNYPINELGEISFLTVETNFCLTKNYIRTDIKDFDITYIKDVKKFLTEHTLRQNKKRKLWILILS